MPKSFRLKGKKICFAAPEKKGLAHDFQNIVLDDEYGLRKLFKHPKTILDVGANIDIFSMTAAGLYPKALIHAYEPNPRIFKYLQSNLAPLNVKIFQEAVGAQAGLGHVCDFGDSRSGVFRAGGAITVTPLVEAVQRLGGTVDLLKLDYEGAEWDIFEARNAFKSISSIRLEYHLVNAKKVVDLIDQAHAIHFKITRLVKNDGFGTAWLDRVSSA